MYRLSLKTIGVELGVEEAGERASAALKEGAADLDVPDREGERVMTILATSSSEGVELLIREVVTVSGCRGEAALGGWVPD